MMKFHITFAAFAVIGFALFAGFEDNPMQYVLRGGLLLAGADLLSTVWWRPLVKPGPVAKALYLRVRDE